MKKLATFPKNPLARQVQPTLALLFKCYMRSVLFIWEQDYVLRDRSITLLCLVSSPEAITECLPLLGNYQIARLNW